METTVGECRMQADCPALAVLSHEVQTARECADKATDAIADERKERGQSITRIHTRLDDVSKGVGEVYKGLLFVVIPLAGSLLLCVIGGILAYALRK